MKTKDMWKNIIKRMHLVGLLLALLFLAFYVFEVSGTLLCKSLAHPIKNGIKVVFKEIYNTFHTTTDFLITISRNMFQNSKYMFVRS